MTSSPEGRADRRDANGALGRESIRWIAFDGVGTLLFPDPPIAVAYHRVGSQHGSKQSQEEVWQRFQERFRAADERDAEEPALASPFPSAAKFATDEERELERWKTIVLEVFDDVDDPLSCFESLYAHFGTPQAWCCHRDALTLLPRLRQAGFRLALASNFDSRLETIADGLPELAPIELRVISSLVGHRKPSGRFYEALVEGAGCRPHEILMVGDDYENDVVGARRAGLQAVHLTRQPHPGDAPTIASLEELAALVGI